MDAAGTQRIADRYRIVRTIASGGMGSVLLAEDERLGRQVAIKRMHAEGAEDALQRFRREARLGASLSHPNLVKIYDAIVDGPDVMILMEYVPGRSLADRLREGPLDRGEAASILRDVACGLDHAHEHGVLHRDVKPGNVLLGPDGRAKIGDLGIATAAEMTRITLTGSIMGTAAYLAPERMEGAPATPGCDIYGLAAVAYEMLSGRRARGGRTPAEIIRRAAVEPPPDVREVDPTIPAAAAEAIRRGLDPDPERRPPSAGALVAGISEHLETAPVPVAPPAPEPEPEPEPVPEDPTLVTPPPPPVRPKRPRSAEPRPAPRRRAAAAASAGPSRRPGLLAAGIAIFVLLGLAGLGAALLSDGSGGGKDDSARAEATATP
ncbi:MAG TPA: serine/threonine-protein kinase, partial [Solirubrobacteraceae bacterium]